MSVPKRLTASLVGCYRIERELGAGGMASVSFAHDLNHERDVAITVLHPDLGAVREGFAKGPFKALGEMGTQYAGVLPTDARPAPYWELAEQLDIPVGIHAGTGPPGKLYMGAAGYRARMHSPFAMEEVLVKRPKLRVYLMHGERHAILAAEREGTCTALDR